jgi:hypothetical protein
VRLLVLLMGLTGNAWGGITGDGWDKVDTDDNGSHYMATRSIRVRGEIVRTWELADIKEPRKGPGSLAFMSMLFLSEDDCKERQNRLVLSVAFSGNMATGIPIHATGVEPWKPVTKGNSRSNARWESLCGQIDKLRGIND